MLHWVFAAANSAIRTKAGEKLKDCVRVRAWRGYALLGPCVEMPAGSGKARIRFSGQRHGSALLMITADKGRRVLAAEAAKLARLEGDVAELPFVLDGPVSDLEVRLLCRFGCSADIIAVEIDLDRNPIDLALDPHRNVGFESRKTYADKIANGFFERYLSGPNIMEIGYKGYEGGTVPIVPQAIGVDVGYAGYDGTSFPFADGTFDAIYSSHCFEHIGPWKEVLRDWYRLLKPGGFLIIVVPHQHLFERKRHLPSYFNPDHKRYYTSRSLLAEVEEAFEENSYRVRHLVENDKDFDYGPPPGQGSSGCYEIELVIEKIHKPYWSLDDGSVRNYAASEFRSAIPPENPWSLPVDCSTPGLCVVYGPYINLPAAAFTAEFYFEPMDISQSGDIPDLTFDVARNVDRIAERSLHGEETRTALIAGKIALPFTNDQAGANFEFRIFVGKNGSSARPIFKGVALRYNPD